MRRASTRDSNEQEIVQALRAVGAEVYRLDRPCDLLVGWRGCNFLIEVKVPGRESRADQAFQAQWRLTWGGQVAVATCPREALAVLGVRMVE